MKHIVRMWIGLALCLGFGGKALAQQVHRNAFEAPKTHWQKAGFDAPFEVQAHVSSDLGAHDGQRSEQIKISAKEGSHVYYLYPVGKAPVSDELAGNLWIKANRPGIQFLARVVFPSERNPNNLEARMTTLIRGDAYQNVGRWQRLDIGRPVQLVKQQQQLLQAQLKRPINSADAYVDALLLNVYAGPGVTDVYIDDLEIGPVVPDTTIRPAAIPVEPGPAAAKAANIPVPGARSQAVEFNANQLLVSGKRFMMRGINHTNTPVRILHQAGFNTLFLDSSTEPATVKEATDLGMWVAPKLRVLSADSKLASAESLQRELARYTDTDAVLLYHFGPTLSFEHAVPISRAAQTVRSVDPGRPIAGEIWDGMLPYSRNLNMLGIHRWPLMTTLELPKYREWLELRRNLANPDAYVWSWIQNHTPDWFTQVLYDRVGNEEFKEPVGPQPEQVQLLTYTALSAGVRGLGFWSDRWLADSHQGRDRLLMCALLNQELEMLEPLLITAGDPVWIGTSSPDVKAAVMPTAKGILVLPIWQGKGSQFVPGQSAVSKLTLIVPQVPQSMQCWEVTPGEVRGLKTERVTGGTKVVIPEFGLTTALVFTGDNQQVVRFQEMSRARRQQAAQWTYDMALYELEKIVTVEKLLEQQGHTLPDAAALINDAQNRLKVAKQLWDNRLFSEAYREAQRSLRPARILMRAQWDAAVKNLDTPAASPYAASFFTLHRHWEFMEQVTRSVPTTNVLSGGDFEIIPERKQEAWKIDEPTLDEVELVAVRVNEVRAPIIDKKNVADKKKADGKKEPPTAKSIQAKPPTRNEPPHEGRQAAMLQVKPKSAKGAPQALERTLVAITSPPVRLSPGSLVQVSGWICIPEAITASADGAVFYDSIGGEPLGVRLTEPTPWKKFTLYRRVPSTGTMQVTLALTGIGTVYFDDVRIEPLVQGAATTAATK